MRPGFKPESWKNKL